MFACLCNVIALVIAPWSMLRNIIFISHQDVKGPSSAEKWYRTLELQGAIKRQTLENQL